MKFTKLVFIALVVAFLSCPGPIKSSMVKPESTRAPCTEIEITGCTSAILGGKPTTQCCDTLKAQQPCFCAFKQTPAFKNLIKSQQAHAMLAACGIPYPTCWN
ncbi:unnamed protein product [Thlaspi arvense]|uniref:Bifunctional inhibitor/plant lipid transfer protein/seed storage helical domain-containing protein n=1 Tax=Thlaspi arvense TaxID=13288 RepID=A0AAU9RPG4_THLAR|nr:unnamed protein product [Thlaspi arvense]